MREHCRRERGADVSGCAFCACCSPSVSTDSTPVAVRKPGGLVGLVAAVLHQAVHIVREPGQAVALLLGLLVNLPPGTKNRRDLDAANARLLRDVDRRAILGDVAAEDHAAGVDRLGARGVLDGDGGPLGHDDAEEARVGAEEREVGGHVDLDVLGERCVTFGGSVVAVC